MQFWLKLDKNVKIIIQIHGGANLENFLACQQPNYTKNTIGGKNLDIRLMETEYIFQKLHFCHVFYGSEPQSLILV